MSGLPKWLTAFNPVNMLVLDNLWKWFSQMYCKRTNEVAIRIWVDRLHHWAPSAQATNSAAASLACLSFRLWLWLARRTPSQSWTRTSMVVRKSNLWKNCVIKMWISRTLVTSFRSTSRSTSMNHSKCRWEGQIHRKYTCDKIECRCLLTHSVHIGPWGKIIFKKNRSITEKNKVNPSES